MKDTYIVNQTRLFPSVTSVLVNRKGHSTSSSKCVLSVHACRKHNFLCMPEWGWGWGVVVLSFISIFLINCFVNYSLSLTCLGIMAILQLLGNCHDYGHHHFCNQYILHNSLGPDSSLFLIILSIFCVHLSLSIILYSVTPCTSACMFICNICHWELQM